MKKSILTFMLALPMLFSIPAYADAENSNWIEDKVRLEKLVSEKKCTEYWGVLWPWAKAENYEARTMLLVLMAPPPHMRVVFAPGSSGDLVTNIRNIVIMAVHSHDIKDASSIRADYGETADGLYKMVGFGDSAGGRKFMECVQNKEAKNCAEIAVQEKLVPSFKNYSAQIDMFMENGMQSTCR
ncbi:MAG: hypothetical protein COA45_06915 [Zetaproteobacteria bacterium]|nr:MAG: hypothetical protein COA45_06915 [Zetaproteobacteria bacterium]